ncbi:hypothetical protein V1478_006015 [Vespula squamosa]|uniref:Uncharacterized protein n=1 Tax=Vespula squamosa TaxID=30214 RepID=A0ABD2B912_VESSQ
MGIIVKKSAIERSNYILKYEIFNIEIYKINTSYKYDLKNCTLFLIILTYIDLIFVDVYFKMNQNQWYSFQIAFHRDVDMHHFRCKI